jgi:hypothetical protein
MVTRSGIPIVYQGQQFPSRKALAKHLAPLLGRSVAALEMALCRHNDNIERVVGGGLVPPVLDLAVNLRIDGSATTEMHRDRETKCREEVRGEAQR